MIIEIIMGLLALVFIGGIIYLFGELGRFIFGFKKNEWGNGFGLLLTLCFLIGGLIAGSYFLGKWILGLF